MGAEFTLSPRHAWSWCCCVSILYVVNLYLVPKRLRALPRSDPSQIKARYVAVTSTALAAVVVTCVLAQQVQYRPPVRTWIGVHTNQLASALVFPLVLTSCLFLGPLATMVCMARMRARYEVTSSGRVRPRAAVMPWHVALREELARKLNLEQGRYVLIRNLVVGPITEEVVFRGCFVPLLLGAGVTRTRIIWLSPLMFGFAHFHHAYEWLRQGHSLPTVVAGVTFQMTFTSIFGAFAAFLQLRTGHLASTILVHAFCNFMGVPDLTFSVAPGIARESTAASALHRYRAGIWFCHGIGIFLFGLLLFPLTSPRLYGSVLWTDN